MITYIAVEIADEHGNTIKSLWCHPSARTRKGKMPTDPLEWFKKRLYEHGYHLPSPEEEETPSLPRHINGEYDG